MNPVEIQNTLQTAITLIRQGQKEQGRELLLQVVAADENNEIAWLWLGAVVDSLADQITALENVLALNPNNHSAQKGLAQLRAQRPEVVPPFVDEPVESDLAEADDFASTSVPLETGTETALPSDWLNSPTNPPPPETESTWTIGNYAETGPVDSVSTLDDPYQCVYCGAIAAPSLKRCPECGRNLMVLEGGGKLSTSLRSAVFMLLGCIAVMAIEAISVAIFYYQGDIFGQFIYDKIPAVNILVGDFRLWPPSITVFVLWVQFGTLAVTILVMLGLLYQITVAYYLSIILITANLLWMVYRWIVGYFGPVLAILDIVLSIVSLFFIFAAQPDFQVNAMRLRCAIDSHIKGGDALNRLGHIAKGKGQWALAVAYWRAAVAAMPNQAGFYKDLAIGYAQIGYYQKALIALNEFAHQSSDATDFAPMQTLIEQKRAKDKYPRG